MTKLYYFQYKYALLKNGGTELINWEKGVDRLADLEIMPEWQMNETYQSMIAKEDTRLINHNNNASGIKTCRYNDVWEEYNMSFTFWHPTENNQEDWIFDNNLAIDAHEQKL